MEIYDSSLLRLSGSITSGSFLLNTFKLILITYRLIGILYSTFHMIFQATEEMKHCLLNERGFFFEWVGGRSFF